MSANLSSLPRSTYVYKQILEEIKTGQLLPGTRLTEVALARDLGVSRTPLREALAKLESEGMLTNDGGRGLVVTQLDHNMISELYQMREVLEATAARLAAQHASEVEIGILRDIAKQDQDLSDYHELAANNRKFHDILYCCGHNRYLLKSLHSLHESMFLLGQTTLSVPGRGESSKKEHLMLVDALERRDADAAEQIVRDHIRAAYQARLSMLLNAN